MQKEDFNWGYRLSGCFISSVLIFLGSYHLWHLSWDLSFKLACVTGILFLIFGGVLWNILVDMFLYF